MRSQAALRPGRTALLSFSRHKLVKGPYGPARGGDINCLPGDMSLAACSVGDGA